MSTYLGEQWYAIRTFHLELGILEGICHLSSPPPTSHPCIPTWQRRRGIGRGRILPVMVDCHCQGTMKWFAMFYIALYWYIIILSFKNELIL